MIRRIKPVYLLAFLAVLVLALIRLSNPYRSISTAEYWQNATVVEARAIPQIALAPGNLNGPVLMWAAMGAIDPAVLQVLVERGALIDETDGLKGSPLTVAAGHNRNPEVIRTLVNLGADINKPVHKGDRVDDRG